MTDAEEGWGVDLGDLDVAFYDPVPSAVPEARRFVLDHAGTTDRATAQRLAAATSELVTNVVLHAHTPFSVRVRQGMGQVSVAVEDGSPGQVETVESAGPAALTGRGLQIVGAIADRWGIEYSETGKLVWFSVVSSEPPSTAGAYSRLP